jgi:hypothetical protein
VRCDASWKKWVTALRKDSLRRLKSAQATNASDCSSWLTPNVPNGGRSVPEATVLAKGQTETGKRTVGLESQVRFWRTPVERDHHPHGLANRTRNVPTILLAHQADAWPEPVRLWGTPTTRDWKDSACAAADVPTNGLLGREAARWAASRLDPENSTPGEKSSPSPRRLNPLFVEWLMGWPIAWTDCDSAAMEWCRWRQRMRLELSRLDSEVTDE